MLDYNSMIFLQALLISSVIALIKSNFEFDAILGFWFSLVLLSALNFAFAYVFKLEIKDFPKLFTLIAFAHLPLIFTAPNNLFSAIHPLLGTILNLGILTWTFNLYVIALSTILSISRRRALLLSILPFVLVAAVLFKFVFSLATLLLS